MGRHMGCVTLGPERIKLLYIVDIVINILSR
jgi:hypothetical protein